MPRYTTYSTGTVTATNGSRTVTGVNTAWMVASTQEFQVVGGDLLRIGNQRPVVIDTVDSPTQVTLVENWPHSTASASAYTVIRYATPPEARVLGALETLAQRGTAASPFERITFDSGGVRFQMRDDGSGLVGLYIGATGTADGSLTLAETINRTTLARILRGPLSWTGTTYMGLLVQSLTTTQRDALSLANGAVWYNSTDNRHQFRANGATHEHVRRSGDTMTGALTLPVNGLVVGSGVNARIDLGGALSGIYVYSDATSASGFNITANTLNVFSSGSTIGFGRAGLIAGTYTRDMTLVDGRLGFGTSSPITLLANTATAVQNLSSVGANANGLTFSQNGAGYAAAFRASSNSADAHGLLVRTEWGGSASIALHVISSGADRFLVLGDGTTRPGGDNSQNLGTGSFRWATVFAGTGTINTSDAREKDNIAPITDALLDKWAGVEAISYRFKDSVDRKGDKARTHFGYTAQQVEEVMGQDAWKYALLCKDQITKSVTRTATKLVQKTETKTVSEETIKIIEGAPTIVVKTRETQDPVVEMAAVIGADGKPVMVEREIEVDGEPEQIEREIEVPGKPDKDGNPTTKKKTVKETITPKIKKTIQEPRLHPVPVMIESEVEETVDEPAGDRLGLRYDQCAVIEAAWLRRELSRALDRIAALEAA